MSNGTVAAQVIPFSPVAPVYNGVHYTPAQAFQGLPTSQGIAYFDPVTLILHVASITTNDGKNLTISAEGKSLVFPISGDGTAAIPVALLAA